MEVVADRHWLYNIPRRKVAASMHCRATTLHCAEKRADTSDVNKDLTFKAKDKDQTLKAKDQDKCSVPPATRRQAVSLHLV